jgi:hypothetical protein
LIVDQLQDVSRLLALRPKHQISVIRMRRRAEAWLENACVPLSLEIYRELLRRRSASRKHRIHPKSISLPCIGTNFRFAG